MDEGGDETDGNRGDERRRGEREGDEGRGVDATRGGRDSNDDSYVDYTAKRGWGRGRGARVVARVWRHSPSRSIMGCRPSLDSIPATRFCRVFMVVAWACTRWMR